MPASYQLMNFPGLPEAGPEFQYQLVAMAARQQLNPDYVAATMYHESGFRPDIVNIWCKQQWGAAWPDHCAVGLIQFMPFVATQLGYTPQELAAMTAVEQLVPVEKFYVLAKKGAGGRPIVTPGDHYALVFAPAFAGKPPDTVIFTKGQAGYDQNAPLDRNGDGAITVDDLNAEATATLAAAAGRPPIDVPDAPDPTWPSAGGKSSSTIVAVLIAGAVAGILAAMKYLWPR